MRWDCFRPESGRESVCMLMNDLFFDEAILISVTKFMETALANFLLDDSAVKAMLDENDISVTKFLADNGDISVTKFLDGHPDEDEVNDISVTKFLSSDETSDNDISVTKFLDAQANDVTVTKFLDTVAGDNDISVTKFMDAALSKFLQ